MIDTAVSAWFDAKASGLDLVLQAGTNATADLLNAAVIGRLSAPGGPLHKAPGGDFAGDRFHVGERVIVRKNYNSLQDPNLRVRNGQAGTVIDARDGRISLNLDGQATPVSLDQHFIAAGGRLSPGYAYTTHRTQGGTWDASIAVGLDGLYREGAYTALSRGRHSNIVIITDPESRQLEAERDADPQRHNTGLRLPTEEPASPTEELTERAGKSRAKRFAIADDPDLAAVDQLITALPYTELRDRAGHFTQIERLATHQVGATIGNLADQLDRYSHTAHHIAPGVSTRAEDRGNVGTVISVDDIAAAAQVHFVAPDGREALRVMDWSELTIIDRDAKEHPLTTPARKWLDAHEVQLRAAEGE